MDLSVVSNNPKLTQQEIDEAKTLAKKNNTIVSDELQDVIQAYEWTQNKDFKMSRIMTNIESILTSVSRRLFVHCKELSEVVEKAQIKTSK